MQDQATAEKANTLAQRFFANSTPLFKILGAVGAFLVICSTIVIGMGVFPVVIPAIIGSSGSMLVIVMFIEADMAKVAENPNAQLSDYLAIMPQVVQQFKELVVAHKSIVDVLSNQVIAKPYIPADVKKVVDEQKVSIPAISEEVVQNG